MHTYNDKEGVLLCTISEIEKNGSFVENDFLVLKTETVQCTVPRAPVIGQREKREGPEGGDTATRRHCSR